MDKPLVQITHNQSGKISVIIGSLIDSESFHI